MPAAPPPAQLPPDQLTLLRVVVRNAARRLKLPIPRSLLVPSAAARRVDVPLDRALPQDPSAAYESLLAANRSDRKSRGSFYTPAPIVERLLDLTLAPLLRARRTLAAIRALRICDPACGAGNFLLAAFDRIAAAHARASGRATPSVSDRRAALGCIRGVDIDPIAAELCRISLWLRVADPKLSLPAAQIQTADSLLADWAALFPDVFPRRGFDAIVGNPPFLSQLDASTAHDRARAATLKSTFGPAVRPYTDPAALFLLLSTRIARPGALVSLIEPVSILASRDTAEVRSQIMSRAAITGLWTAGQPIFDANVRVCAPVLRIGSPASRVRRWKGPDFESLPDAPAADISPDSWAPLAAIGVPDIHIRSPHTLADLATATADFRDQYYGLRGHVVEDAALNGADRRAFPPLITTGLIDAGRCLWGSTPTRFNRQPFAAPRIDLAALTTQTDLGPWARSRLVPKVLLATQTRVLEAAVDPRGDWLPAVPVITIAPRDPDDLWLIAAAVLSPVASAWALRHFGGAGLSHEAIKLSAKQALQIPIPSNRALWSHAADQLLASTDRDALRRAAALTCRAHLLSTADTDRLLSWWQARLPSYSSPHDRSAS